MVVVLDLGNLERAIAKDCGEDRGGKVGDDGQQDCHAGCDSKENDMIEGSEVEIITLL